MHLFSSARVSAPDNEGTEGGGIAGYVTENEGNRCARKRAFNVKTTPTENIK